MYGKIGKKLVAMLLALVMIMGGMLPLAVVAEGAEEPSVASY